MSMALELDRGFAIYPISCLMNDDRYRARLGDTAASLKSKQKHAR